MRQPWTYRTEPCSHSAAPLADGTGALAAVLFPIAALAVVGLLIGGFLLGKRKKDTELPPPLPDEQPSRPEERTHIDRSDPHSTGRFPEDGHSLSPYELNDHGNEPIPPDTDPPRS
ncbi:Secreted protein OS=Streptomyces microflavus OX=1919 GN=Smic_00160 PE=4 SV=1 [Streptomyces microflavus]